MLFIGEKVGAKGGFKVDIAVDPLEGTTLCAKNMPGAIATHGDGRGAARCCTRPTSTWTRSRSARAIPRAWSISTPRRTKTSAIWPRPRASTPQAITAMMLDRPRHADLIAAVRKAGAAVSLITDGDVAGVIHTAEPDKTGIDIYLGIGGAPEGVLAAAALRCIGGQMQMPAGPRHRGEARARRQDGHQRPAQEISDRGHGAAAIACSPRPASPTAACCRASSSATAVIETETVVMRSVTGTVRWIKAEHRQLDKF